MISKVIIIYFTGKLKTFYFSKYFILKYKILPSFEMEMRDMFTKTSQMVILHLSPKGPNLSIIDRSKRR